MVCFLRRSSLKKILQFTLRYLTFIFLSLKRTISEQASSDHAMLNTLSKQFFQPEAF